MIKTIFKTAANFFIWVIAIALSIFSLWAIIDKNTDYSCSQFGYRFSVIISNSMSEKHPTNDYLDDSMFQYQKYDVIITKEYESFEDIKKYDAISYYSGKSLICHRVVDKYVRTDGEEFVVTRGDANNVNDAPVNFKNVKGKVIKSISGLGQVLLFFQSPYFVLCICGVGFFITLGVYMYSKEEDIDYRFGLKRRK